MTYAPAPQSTIREWLRLLAAAGVSPSTFVVPGMFMLAAAALEGASVALLVPTLEGLLAQDFSRVKGLPVLGWALRGPLNWAAASESAMTALLVATIAGAILLKVAAFFRGRVIFAARATGLADSLRRRLMRRFLGFGKRFFDDHNAAHLQDIVLSHTARVGEGAAHFGLALSQVFTIAVFGALMVWLSWKLTLVAGALFPLLYLSLGRLVRRVGEQSHHAFEVQRRIHELTFNILSTLPLVKSYHQEARESERFADISGEAARAELGQMRRLACVGPIHELLLLAFVILVVLFAVRFRPEAANVLVFFYVLKRTSTYLNDLNHVRAELGRISGSLAVVLDGLTDPGKPVVADGALEFTGLREEIEVERLNFAYSESGRRVLSDVSFRVRRGTTTAIVGRTGSGKSTLINLLLRFYDVGPGMIRFDGVDVRDFLQGSLRRRLALVPQECQLFSASFGANLLYGLEREVPEAELSEVLRAARLKELIERLPKGLETMIGDRGVKLSGGEKQRLALARALLKRAEVLILDEATSSLDSQTERLVQEAIDECLVGRTAIVVAHRLATIQHADQVVLIEDGAVVEQGTLDELLATRGAFYAYWEAQRFERGRVEASPDPVS